MSHIDEVFLHVPRAGGTAFGAKPAMQADVFVLDHDTAGFESVGDIESLIRMRRGRLETVTQVTFLAILRKGDAVHRADIDASIAFDAQWRGEYRLDVAIQATLRF